MSKQKKKKPNTRAQQKLLLAQKRNQYIRKIQWVCSLLGGAQCFKMLENDLDILFGMRPQALKIIVNDSKVPEKVIEYVKYNLNTYMDNTTSEIYEGGARVSYRDWIYVLSSIHSFFHVHTELRDPEGIIDKFLENHIDRGAKIMLDILHRAEFIGVIYSDFCDHYFQVKYTFEVSDEPDKIRVGNTVTIKMIPASWRQIRVGAGKRTAARVGWSYSDRIHWMTVRMSQLGIKNTGDNQPMDVYMQQHALNRMHERIDGIYEGMMNANIIESFLELTAFPTGGGNFLIEHRISRMKAGYYLATITNGVLLIRTFLFITHNGTPEGRKLASITGLGKLDQKYLAFDNLLTLANSDILSNDEAKEIFVNAGCSDLLDLCRMVRNSKSFWQVSEQEKPLAEKLLKYIKSAKEEISDERLDFWANEE